MLPLNRRCEDSGAEVAIVRQPWARLRNKSYLESQRGDRRVGRLRGGGMRERRDEHKMEAKGAIRKQAQEPDEFLRAL